MRALCSTSARPRSKPTSAGAALTAVQEELREALGQLDQTLDGGDGPVRLDDEGNLAISPPTAEDVPTEATALKPELAEMLSFA